MAKHTFLNTAAGPRGINAIDGYAELAPGERRSLDVSDAELKAAERAGYFDIGGKAPAPGTATGATGAGGGPLDRDASGAAGGSLPGNVMKLKKIARDEGIDVGDAKTVPTLQAAITAARTAKATAGGGTTTGTGNDDLDTLDDETLRTTTAALLGKPVDGLPTDRGELLELARGVGQ